MHSSSVGNCGPKRDYSSLDNRSAPPKRSARFAELLGEFGNQPHAMSERELNELVCECMVHGDAEVLRDVLKDASLEALEIAGPTDDRAWEVLLLALPESCSIKTLILSEHEVHSVVTGNLQLKIAGQIPKLEKIRFHDCKWYVGSGALTCPTLSNLQELHVQATDNPLSLVNEILKASRVSRFHFAWNTGMSGDDHASLAQTLSARCEAKLRHLTLRGLRSLEPSPEGLLKHYVAFLAKETTTLTHLDLSENRLNAEMCARLSAARKGKRPLVDLKLAGCWCSFDADWKSVAQLDLDPESLDLSCNAISYRGAEAVFASLGRHGRLRHLDLRETTMQGTASAELAYRLKSLKLVSLRLPSLRESEYKAFIDAVPDSLRVLRIEGSEESHRTWMTDEEFASDYPNYVALMTRVHRNWLAWKETVLPSATKGMSVVLGGMGGIGPELVPSDIARDAAHWALDMTGDDIKVLTLLNKHSAGKE